MKRFLTIIFIFVNINVYGQTLPDMSPNAVTANYLSGLFSSVPGELLLIIPDETARILQFPARGAGYDKSFFYLSREYPLNSLQNIWGENIISAYDFNLIGFLNKPKSKYMFSLQAKSRFFKSVTRVTPSDSSLLISDSYFREDFRKDSRSENGYIFGDISRIYGNSEKSFSLGIFAVLNYDLSTGEEKKIEKSHTYLEHTTHIHNRIGEENLLSHSKSDFNYPALGIMYSSSDGNVDRWGEVDLQYYKYDFYDKLDSHETYDDSTFYLDPPDTFSISRKTDLILDQNRKVALPAYHFSGYSRRNLSSDLFFTLRWAGALLPSKKVKYMENYTKHDEYISDYSNKTDYWYKFQGKEKVYYYSIYISPGIFGRSNFQKFRLYYGISFKSLLKRNRTINVNSDHLVNRITRKNLNSELSLPLMIYYSPVRWMDIHFAFSHYFSFDKEEVKTILVVPEDYSSSLDFNDKKESNRELRLTRVISLGTSLNFHKRIYAFIGFTSSLDAYQSWNISVGYHY